MGFGFKNIGHYIAVVARDIVKVGQVADKAEPVIELATSLVAGPYVGSAITLERAMSAALGHVTKAAGDITTTGTDPNAQVVLSVPMLVSEVADFKEILTFFQSLAKKQGVVVG